MTILHIHVHMQKLNHVEKYNKRRNSLEETKYTKMKTAQTNQYIYIYKGIQTYKNIYLSTLYITGTFVPKKRNAEE